MPNNIGGCIVYKSDKRNKQQYILQNMTWKGIGYGIIYAMCLLVAHVNQQACSPLVWTCKNGNKFLQMGVEKMREDINERMVLITKP